MKKNIFVDDFCYYLRIGYLNIIFKYSILFCHIEKTFSTKKYKQPIVAVLPNIYLNNLYKLY